MKAFNIREDIFAVGVKDWNLQNFHGYKVHRGSTYNSYLIMDKKITIIDGVKECLSEEQISRIKSVVDFSKITYLVANHIEPDHSGSIQHLVKLAPQVIVVTDAQGKSALDAHYNTEGWNFQIVKTGDVLNLGKRNLTFVTTPMLHWPDSMMTYCAEEKILFSNDGFGQHYPADTLYADEANLGIAYDEALHYYVNILYPYGAQADKVLNQAHELNLDIEMIAPSHGLIWRGADVQKIMSLYAKWAKNENQNKAVVIYDSMWGSTAKLAEAVMAEFQDQGIPTVKRCLSVVEGTDVLVDIMDAKYIAIGNPTLNNQLFPNIAKFMTYIKGLQPKNKKGFAFGSYGWKPGIVNQIDDTLKDLGWQTVTPFEERYTPKPEDLEAIRQRVRELIKL